MCDTFVHIPSSTTASVIFGKNSDREPNEAQQIVSYSRNIRDKKTIQATFIEVEHPAATYEVILSKPFQMWGAEMGCNEYGVCIGNEAVFTKMPFDKKNIGLTGMDLLRLSLEISKAWKILFLILKNMDRMLVAAIPIKISITITVLSSRIKMKGMF